MNHKVRTLGYRAVYPPEKANLPRCTVLDKRSAKAFQCSHDKETTYELLNFSLPVRFLL